MTEGAPTTLRFLRSDQLLWPLPTDQLDVWCGDELRIGKLDGVIIDPPAHQACYLVVGTRRFLKHDSYLLPINAAQVDLEHHAVRVNVDSASLTRCRKFERGAFPAFSDEDLLDAMFSPREGD